MSRSSFTSLLLALALLLPAPAALANDPAPTGASSAAAATTNATRATRARTARANATGARRTRATAATRRATLARRMTHEERANAARAVVEQNIQRWVPANQRVSVTTGMIAPDSRSNPLTGEGLISVFTRQSLNGTPTRWARMRHFFNPYRAQRFVVNVAEGGEATILAFHSTTLPSKIGSAIRGLLSYSGLVRDLVTSSGGREGLMTLGAGVSLATAIHQPAVAGAAVMRAVQMTVNEVSARTALRLDAARGTVRWARSRVARGQSPTISDAYSHYSLEVERLRPGLRPVPIEVFAEQLRGLW